MIGELVTQFQTTSAPSNELDREQIYTILSARRRRYVLHFLYQREEPTELRELATKIAAWENKRSVDAITSNQRKCVYTALRQAHLPKMDDQGVIEFDPVSGRVALADRAADLDAYLEIVPDNEIPWSTFYLGLGVFCWGLFAASQLNLFPFSLLPLWAWTAVNLMLFTGTALVHTIQRRRIRLGRDGPPPELTY